VDDVRADAVGAATLGGMDGRPNPFAKRGGVALRSDLLAAGYDDRDLRTMLRRGAWVRIRRGAYVEAAVWEAMDDEGRHLLLCRAVQAVLAPPAVLSHVSAAVALGLPVWGVDLAVVHVTRPERGQGRHEAGVVHHVAALPADHVLVADGLRVTAPARTVLDLARAAGFEPGVVTADAALHRSLVSKQQLLELHLACGDWPGSRVAGRVVDFADRLAESVGESRTRVLFLAEGLPKPRLQVRIFRGPLLLGRVDLYVDEALSVVEFDGRLKYRIDPGDDPGKAAGVLWAEKLREDDIRGEGHEFARVTWPDLDRPAATAQRLRVVFDRGRRRRRGWPA
jgi:hypothetical protein